MNNGTLTRTLIERGDYEQLRGSHELLRNIAANMPNDPHWYIIRQTLAYAERYTKYPSWSELEEFMSSSSFVDVHDCGPNGKNGVGLEIRQLQENTLHYPVHNGSWPQFLDDATIVARENYFQGKLKEANYIIGTGLDIDKKTTLRGVNDALKFLDQARAKDFTLPLMAPEGGWRENSELQGDTLLGLLDDTQKSRCYTGFKHVDDTASIGPQQSIRFVGVLGYTNHRKSFYLRSMAYSMARAGKKVLFIALEDSALNTWFQLSYLHSYHRPDLHIPDLNTFLTKPKRVTEQHRENVRLLMHDLQHGDSVKGEIVVKTLNRWPLIVQELEVGLNGKPYDAVVIDYVGHLKTDAMKDRERHGEITMIFAQIQSLCQTYKSGRGIVAVTALQSNKEGKNAADALDGDDWGEYSTTAVEMYTNATRDLDLIIGLWHQSPLKQKDMLKVSCVKSRQPFFRSHFLAIDRRTQKLLDLPGGPKADLNKIDVYQRQLDGGFGDPNEIDISAEVRNA